jgi:GNAT superfamily N-acetyltransferase
MLRPGRPDDAAVLRDLTWRLTIAHPAYGDQARARPQAVEAPTQALSDGGVIVAEVEGRAVGYVTVVQGEEDAAEVDGLFVDADFQRGGIGRRLLEAAADTARRRGASGLRVVSAPDAVAVYEAFGFGDPEATQTLFGPAVILRMALPPQ